MPDKAIKASGAPEKDAIDMRYTNKAAMDEINNLGQMRMDKTRIKSQWNLNISLPLSKQSHKTDV